MVKEDLRRTYELIVKHFDATRAKAWPEAEDFLKGLKEKKVILDFGSGTGRHSLFARQFGHDATALDFALAQLLMLKKKSKEIKLVQGDVSSAPLKDKSFDVILYVATIHHLPTEDERLKSLAEVKRLLKEKGKVLISAWAFEQERFKGSKKQDVTLKWAKKYPRFYHLFKEGELEQLVKKAGFKVERAWRSADNYWVIAFI